MRNVIQNINWECLENFNDVDDAYSNFQETFLSLYNTFIPEKNYSKKDSKTSNKPWITKGFIKSTRIKLNKLYKRILNNGNEELKARYKYHRNRLNKLKDILKKKYYERQFELTNGNIKQTWQLINDVLNRKKTETENVTEFKTDNEPVTDGREIVNRFNAYFVNVGPNLAKKVAASANLPFKDYLKGSYIDSMLLSSVCEQEVKIELEHLDPCIKKLLT